LVRETLAASAQTNEPMVLIDKLNRECHILRHGRVVETFPVEMGNSWMERKLTEGDRATPEGRYQISALKGHGNSRYYKAALLNYPNQTDRSRFVKAKRAGQISRGARIGGMIEIHGEGGRGNNWTAGCVSLANADMDRLMSFLRAGTPVTIVGVWQDPSWLSSGGLSMGGAASGRAD
jgi:murein L,D-transpeptidase YafK